MHSFRIFRFGDFELDQKTGTLRKHGIRIKLQDQPLRILTALLERPEELITRDELRAILWPANIFVDFDRRLNNAITKLRLVLCDSAEKPRFIETIPRHGYRLIIPVLSENHVPVDNQQSGKLEVALQPLQTAASAPSVASILHLRSPARVLYATGILAAIICVSFLGYTLLSPRGLLLASPRHARRSIAVLGFRNLSGDGRQDWLSPALSDWLGAELYAGQQLRTISAESVARMKVELSVPDVDTLEKSTLARVRSNLGCDLVVIGSYASLNGDAGKAVRLDVRLQNAKTGDTVATISEVGSESRLFDLVSRTGERLRAALGLAAITPQENEEVATALPSNPEAARFYSEGVSRLRLYDAMGARHLLELSLAKQSESAQTHCALANALSTLGYSEQARAEARKAMDLASTLPRADRLRILATLSSMENDWDKAIDTYRAIYEFFPDSVDDGLSLARAQISADRGRDALTTLRALQEMLAPIGNDPRLDLARSSAAGVLGDLSLQLSAAQIAAEKAESIGAPLLLAFARKAETWPLEHFGRLDEALKLSEQAKQEFIKVGDKAGVASSLTFDAIALGDKGDTEASLGSLRQALALYRELGDKLGIAGTLNNVSDELSRGGDLPAARQALEEALATYEEVKSSDGVALAKSNLGALLLAEGDVHRAKQMFTESLRIYNNRGKNVDQDYAAWDQDGLGRVARIEGDQDLAQKYFEQVITTYHRLGSRTSAASTSLDLATLLIDRSDVGKAITVTRSVAAEFREMKMPCAELAAEIALSRAQLAKGEIASAQQTIRRAMNLAANVRHREMQLDLAIVAARVDIASGDHQRQAPAIQQLKNIVSEAVKMKFREHEFEARLALGEAEINLGSRDSGANALELLERDARRVGYNSIARQAAAALKVSTPT